MDRPARHDQERQYQPADHPLLGRRLDDGDHPAEPVAGRAAGRPGLPRPAHRPLTRARVDPGDHHPARSVDRRRPHDLGSVGHRGAPASTRRCRSISTTRRTAPARPSPPSWAVRGAPSRSSPTPGSLPGAWQDGYWRTGNVVHILTRPPVAVRDPHGHRQQRQRGAARLRSGDRLRRADAALGTRHPAGAEVRALCRRKPRSRSSAASSSRSSSARSRPRHAPVHAHGAQPARRRERSDTCAARGAAARRPVAGCGGAGARCARLHHRQVVQVAAPGIPAGTVVGPTGVHVLEEGSAVDIQVASTIVRSPFALQHRDRPTARRVNAHARGSCARSPIPPASTSPSTPSRTAACSVGTSSTSSRGDDPDTETAAHAAGGPYDLHWKATSDATKLVRRKITTIRVIAANRARSQNVVSVTGGRTTQGATKGLKHVSHLTPDQAFLYATYHTVGVMLVDTDVYGPTLARDLHRVFPSSRSSRSRRTLPVALP